VFCAWVNLKENDPAVAIVKKLYAVVRLTVGGN